MSKINFIIFDLDGVLVETKDLHFKALNKSLLDSINLSSTKWLGVCFVLKKNTNEEFKFPYQGAYEKLKYHHYGFNKLYLQNPMSYSFVPQFSLANIKFKELIIEIIKRLKKKFKLIK